MQFFFFFFSLFFTTVVFCLFSSFFLLSHHYNVSMRAGFSSPFFFVILLRSVFPISSYITRCQVRVIYCWFKSGRLITSICVFFPFSLFSLSVFCVTLPGSPFFFLHSSAMITTKTREWWRRWRRAVERTHSNIYILYRRALFSSEATWRPSHILNSINDIIYLSQGNWLKTTAKYPSNNINSIHITRKRCPIVLERIGGWWLIDMTMMMILFFYFRETFLTTKNIYKKKHS